MTATSGAAGSWLAALAEDLEQVARRLQASVVEVHTRGHGSGAGTIWDAGGTIVTNHHVVPGDGARVRLSDGRELEARTVARDADNDLAVLQVDAVGLPAVSAGDARKLKPGEIVLAVGHPFGVKGALTVGVVSAAHSEDEERRQLVRADVRLGPGNSGGPLADATGRVVGINSMVNGGMALAVPSHLVERLIGRRAGGRTLGVAVRDVQLSPVVAAAAGLRVPLGALITGIRAGSAADQAGLLAGDIVVSMGSVSVESATGLAEALNTGDAPVRSIRVLRGGVPRSLDVDLDARAAQHAA